MNNESVLTIITDKINKYLKPKIIYLFGSRAKGKYRINSDFDIAIDCETIDFIVKSKLKDEIDDAIGIYSADIVFINEVENDFKELILNTGRIIYERS